MDKLRQLLGTPLGSAVVFFVFLYLYRAFIVTPPLGELLPHLLWPVSSYTFDGWNYEPKVGPQLYNFIGVIGLSLYVYRLKLKLAKARVARSGLDERASRHDEELRAAREAYAGAEKRAAAAEAKAAAEARAAAQARADARARRGEAARPDGSAAGDNRFVAAKRAFARLFHPDNVKADGLDKIIRTEVFKEYWRELEAIEKTARKQD